MDTRPIGMFDSGSGGLTVLKELSALLPSKMIEPFIERTGVDAHKKVNSITKEERAKILSTLKGFNIELHALRPIDEAIITSGGIEVKEISPKMRN